MKQNKLKPIEIGFGDDKVIFHLRMISVAEEDSVQQRFNDVADDFDKWQKEFEICRDAICEFSIEMPERLEKENGEFKKVALVEDTLTPEEAIGKFFAERTVENERVIRDAFWLFKRQLAPEARFL